MAAIPAGERSAMIGRPSWCRYTWTAASWKGRKFSGGRYGYFLAGGNDYFLERKR